MNEEDFKILRSNWLQAERIFSKLNDEKKLNRKQKKEIEKRLEVLSHYVWLNNPKIKNKQFKSEISSDLLSHLKNLNSPSVRIGDVNRSNSAEAIM